MYALARAPSPFNLTYLAAKSRSGHALDVATAAPSAAELPEPVDAFEPAPVATVPSLLRVASYLLPVLALPPAEGVHWLRLHLYVDRDSGRERVVLTLARARDARPLVHVHAETLPGRFPRQLRDDPWRTAVERIAARGAGVALFLLHDEPGIAVDGDARAHVAARPNLARLLAAHLPPAPSCCRRIPPWPPPSPPPAWRRGVTPVAAVPDG